MSHTPIFMNLLTDFAFKRLFGSVERKHILIRFLNILFKKDGMHVDDVTFHDKEVLPEDENGKRIVYDVYCTTPREKEHFIVEMQQAYNAYVENRFMFYAAKALASQGKRGNRHEYNPVYGIFFVNFDFPHLHKNILHDVRMADVESHEVFSNLLRLLFISLEQTKKTWEECDTEFDKITFIIKNMHNMDKNSKAYTSGEFEDMFREAEINNMAKEDIVAYSQSQYKYEDNLAALDYCREESMKEGIEKGKFETAKKLLSMGMSADFIKEATGLSPDEYIN